jgi:hypothetical protein
MRLSSRFLSLLLVLFVLVGISSTTFAAIHTSATPKARVTARVDSSKRTTLYGHVPAAVRHGLDMGRVDPDTKVEHLIMVLKSDEDQKREVRRIIDEQQDKRTANYHQWVTPEEFGAHFGVHDSDIENIKAWLASEGMTVESVTKSKRALRFSGTIGQLEHAFQTEMHHFSMPNGETHVSNNRDISVPEAFNKVIAGVPTLNDFFRKSHRVDGGTIGRNSKMKLGPKYTSSSSVHYVSAADFATIYNTAPLLAQGVNGSGVTIGIVGRSDILLSDVQTYRQMMGLPPNDPNFIHAGQDQGVLPGDDGESDLDVEISGGAAPGATIDFVIGTPTFLVDGITNSTEYIIENNIADIMSVSYGDCEANEGAGGNAFNSQIFEQAAAQGISVFIASGDNGPAGCDDQSTQTYEVLGYAAPAEGSTWYTVAVGGTEFYGDQGAGYSTYWSSTNNSNLSSALSYIPEYPWNEARVASPIPTGDSGSDLWSGSGAISAYYLRPSWQTGSGINNSTDPTLTLANGAAGNWVASVTITNPGSGYTSAPAVTFGSGCTGAPAATGVISGGQVTGVTFTGYTSHFQGFNCTSVPTVTFAAPTSGTTATGTAVLGPMQYPPPLIAGVPHRLTPDVSLNAASGHDATFFCSEGVCELNSSGALVDAGLVGGTSVAAPSMAGIQALINQVNGGRQGMPGYMYYTLAAAQNDTLCNSSTPPASGSNCAFQDVTLGNNFICGLSGSSCSATLTAAKIGFGAGTGYDMATGLGSPNAANLASQWSSVVFNSSNTALNLSQTSFQHGTSITLSGTVAAGSGSGTPTGDVAFIVSQGAIGDIVNPFGDGSLNGPVAFATLSGGAYTATLNNLPGGTYYVTARYGGDQNFASSLSAGVQVTVSQEGSGLTITPYSLNGTACTITSGTSFAYSSDILVNLNVAGISGAGAPTGTVALSLDGTQIASLPLDPNGNAFTLSGAIPSSSCIYDYNFDNVNSFAAGSHTLTATYSGDGTYNASTATPVAITVSQLTPTLTLAAGATVITTGFNDKLVATFGGLTGINGNSTMSSAPTGTVTFTDTTTSTVLGTAPVVSTVLFSGNNYTNSAYATISTTGITTTGANSITATYSGDTNWAAASSAAVTVTVGTGTATSVAVTSNANPTTLNGRPTFTATVATASAGAVTFYDGTAVLGAGSTVGTAHTSTFRPASGAAFWGGTHNITAIYGGSGTTMASTSPVFVETVTQGTNTINLTAKTAGTSSQVFTLAAVLTPSSTTAAYAPNQSVVNFFDGATNIGSAQPLTITSGQGGYGLWTATVTVSLSAGTHTITATYSDINYSLATSNAQTVTVGGNQTITFTTPAPSSAAMASNFTVAATASSGLAVAYTSFGSCTNSGATYTMTKGTGTCYVIANQAGNSSYGPAPEVTETVAATKGSQTITFTTAPPASAAYGSQFTVAATGGASGNAVVFTSAGGCTNSGAIYTMTSPTTACSVIANQAGNANWNAASTVTDNVSATQATTSLNVTSVSPAAEDYGSTVPVTITAMLAWSGSGVAPTASAVTIGGSGLGGSLGSTSCGAASGDTITCTNTYTPSGSDAPGSYTFSAAFSGDTNYTGSSSSQTNNFAIGIASSTTSVTSSQNPSTYAQPVTFTATINGENGNVKGGAKRKGAKPQVVSGTVAWSTNTGCGTTPVTSGNPGIATCTTSRASSLEVGTDTVTATYSGDSNHTGSTGSVNQVVQGGIATTIDVTSVSPAAEAFGADMPVTITAVLTWTGNGVAPTASDVTISGNGNGTYGVTSCAPRVHESITCTATYTPTTADTPASYTETATFAGDTNYSGSTSPETNNFTINGAASTTAVTSTPNPSVYATSVTFTATITSNTGNVKGGARKNGAKPMDVTGTVTWSANTGCSPSTVSGYPGVATCTTSAATHLPVGTDVVTATYSGDGNHAGSSGSVNQVVQGGIATAINVTSVSPASEDYGAGTPVTITAVLSWTGHGTAPTASDVTIGGNGPSGYSATSCGARAGDTITCTATYTPTTADTPGSYTETAAFSGDINYASSSSSQTNNFTINQATSTTGVTSNNNPSTYGQPVTFTATISGENGNVKGGKGASTKPLVVTGTVTWSANTGCSPSTVSGYPGVATCTTSSLAGGTNTITATYSGDGNHSGSSGSVSGGQVVNQASQTITFTVPPPAAAAAGNAFTVVATGGASGNPVTFTVGAGSVCTVSGATYTITSTPGHCYVVANQAGNSNYAPAPQVVVTVNAGRVTKVAPTVTFTGAPTTAPYLSTFTVATTANSGVTPTITSMATTICTVSGNVVTMKLGTGTCTVKAAWKANLYYLAASLTQSVTATPLSTNTTITSTATLTPSNLKKVTVYYGVSNGQNTVAGNVKVTASSGETCTGTVAAGKCVVTFAATGPKTLTAVYAGNDNNVTSTSAPFGVTVQ